MNRDAGFSLIELMCAIVILGIGIVGITHGLTTALGASKDSEQQSIAALLAAGRIETVRAEGYYETGESEGEFDEGMAAYRWTQSISETELDGLFDLRVTILSAKSGTEIYTLETMVFEAPIADDTTRSDAERKRRNRS